MGADTPPGMAYKAGDNITVSLSGDDGDELRGYWEKLSDGGTVAMPLEKQMWGDEFGMCTDRFGINWMVNIGQAAGLTTARRGGRRPAAAHRPAPTRSRGHRSARVELSGACSAGTGRFPRQPAKREE